MRSDTTLRCGRAIAAAALLTCTSCRVTPEPIVVSGSGHVPSPVLVMPPRVCLEQQVDNVRRLRAGPRGLVTTNEVVAALRAAVPSGPTPYGASVTDSCGELLDADLHDDDAAIDRYVATRGLVGAMKRSGARSALVTEIATRLVCAHVRRGTPGGGCFEDDVTVTAILFDDTGRIVRAASAHVTDPGRALAVARAALPTTTTSAAPTPWVPQPCRLTHDTLDCT